MDRSWSARGTSRSQAQEGSEGPQLRRALRRRREWGAAGDMDDRHNSRLEEVDHHRSDAGHELCLPGSCFGTVGLYRLERFDQLHLRLVLSRGEVDVKAGSFRKPIPDDCGLVCTVVIHIEVNVEVGGHVRLDGIQEVRRSLRLRPSPQNSCGRAMQRAISRLATLAQAISRTRASATIKPRNTGPTGPVPSTPPASASLSPKMKVKRRLAERQHS